MCCIRRVFFLSVCNFSMFIMPGTRDEKNFPSKMGATVMHEPYGRTSAFRD